MLPAMDEDAAPEPMHERAAEDVSGRSPRPAGLLLEARQAESPGGTSPGHLEPPATNKVTISQTVDRVVFWMEWNSHKERVQTAFTEYVSQQERLVRGLIGEMPEKLAGPPVHKIAPSRSSSQLTGIASYGDSASSESTWPPTQPHRRGGAERAASSSRAPDAGAFAAAEDEDGFCGGPPSAAVKATETNILACTPSHRPVRRSARERFINTYDTIKKKDFEEQKLDKWAATVRKRFSAATYEAPQTLVAAYTWWLHLKEPPRTGRLAKWVLHHRFDAFISFVILLNAIYTAWQANYEMDHVDDPSRTGDTLLDTIFVVIYTVELVLKLAVHRIYFFCNSDMSWNCFDFVLVMLSLTNLLLASIVESLGNVAFARSLRVFKMGKILRIFRAMRMLKELRVMLASIIGSFASLFWSIIMIGMINYIFALLFIQQMTTTLAAEEETPLRAQQLQYFRNVERTCLTLMEVTMGGVDWDVIYMLIQPLGLFYITAFVFYIVFFNFAVLNILTGIFVENAMKLCQPDVHEAMALQREKQDKENNELRRIISAMDVSDDGRIWKDDFVAMASFEEVKTCFAAVGIDLSRPEAFFRMISMPEGDESFEVEEFVQRTLQIKNSSLTSDMTMLKYKMHELLRIVDHVRHVERTEIEAHVSQLRSTLARATAASVGQAAAPLPTSPVSRLHL